MNNMKEAIQAIIDPLRELTSSYRHLIALAVEKREAIVANKVDAVLAIANRESKLLKAIEESDRKRETAVRRFMDTLGMAVTKSFRMEQLILFVTDADAKRGLTRESAELIAATRELESLNDLNQQLIRTHLEYIQYSIDVIAGPSEDEATYHRSLQDQGFVRPSQFDAKA